MSNTKIMSHIFILKIKRIKSVFIILILIFVSKFGTRPAVTVLEINRLNGPLWSISSYFIDPDKIKDKVDLGGIPNIFFISFTFICFSHLTVGMLLHRF